MRALKATLYTIGAVSMITVIFLGFAWAIRYDFKLFVMSILVGIAIYMVYKIWKEFYEIL